MCSRCSDLAEENVRLQRELDLVKGVFTVMKEDLNVKNEQIDFLYHRYTIRSFPVSLKLIAPVVFVLRMNTNFKNENKWKIT